MRKLIFCLIFCVFGITGLCRAQQEEKLTITTYYPSPTGIYQTLKVVQRADFNTGLNPGYDHLVIHGKDPGSSYGVLSFSANNTAGDVNIASIWGVIQSDTVGAESGGLAFATKSPTGTMDAGARMFINASGYVGIGTGVLNPAAKLDVRTNTTDDGISLSDGNYFIKLLPGTTGAGSYNNIVQAQNNALIFGNGTPSANPEANPESLVIAPWENARSGLRMNNSGLLFTGGQMELGQRATDGTAFANDTHMLRFWGKSGCASNALHEGGRIYGMMDGCNWLNTELHLEAANNWDSWVTNQLVLRGNGNVGIRTPEPYSRLHIANNVATLPITDYSQYQILLWNGTTAQASNSYGMGISSSTMWFNSNRDYRFIRNGATTDLFINGTGVGIGTTTPSQRLHVVGHIMGSLPDGTNQWYLERGSDQWLRLYQPVATYQSLAVGPFWANGATRFDLAEITPVNPQDTLEAGDVVCIDKNVPVRMTRCQMAYDTLVAGIVSDPDTASMVIGGDTPPESIKTVQDKKPIALVGRVTCKVTSAGGPIAIGDMLVTSNEPGCAMKADPKKLGPGMLVGKALEASSAKSGKIKVWLTAH